MRKIFKSLIVFFLLPSIVFAQDELLKAAEPLVKVLIEIVAVISVIELIYAGFLLATAQGDPEKAKTAKSILVYATIGIGIAVMALALGQFVISQFGSQSTK